MTDNDSSNDQQQNNNTSGGGKKYVVGIDHGGGGHGYDDQTAMATVAKQLESCGNSVDVTQVGPNQETYLKGHDADVAVYLCNGVDAWTMWSFVSTIKSGGLPFTIFAMEGWYHDESEPEGTLADMEHVRAEPFKVPHDGNKSDQGAMDASTNATTVGEYVDENSQYIGLCYAKTPEEMGQNICSGNCGGGGSSGSMVNSGGGAQIKDLTFENCIRRICAATDSVFIVENNAAVLFPYTDWLAFTLREKIQTITSKEIDPEVFSMEYGTQGFYNKVTIAWGGETLPERFPDNPLMHKKYLEAQKNKTETVIKKKNTTQKMSTDTDGTNLLSEQYNSLVDKYGELEKRIESAAPDLETAQYLVNALLIQYVRDFNNVCQCRSLANRKYLGGTFYVVTNPFTYEKEMLYLNGYTVRTQKDTPIYFDLDFRYGPESAEELLDYQFYTGGTGGQTGQQTNESSSSEEAIWQHASKFCHQWSCEELREAESDTNDPQVAEDYVNKKEKANTPKICLSCYGMSAWLYYQFNYKANIPCHVIFAAGHKVVELYKDNKWYKPIQEYRQLDRGFRYDDAQMADNVPVSLEAPGGPK